MSLMIWSPRYFSGDNENFFILTGWEHLQKTQGLETVHVYGYRFRTRDASISSRMV